EARQWFSQAVAILEAQRRQIPSPEARSLFLAHMPQPATGLLRACVALHDLPAAFTTLDRSRARSFVELLAERAASFSADAPHELLDRQQALDRRRDATYRQLSRLDPGKDSARIEPLRAEIA